MLRHHSFCLLASFARRALPAHALWVGLATAALAACVHWPVLLTTAFVRDLYGDDLHAIRSVTWTALIFACGSALLAYRTGKKRILVGIAAAAIGGWLLRSPVTPLRVGPGHPAGGVSLDWLVIDGLVLTSVIIPLERVLARRRDPVRRKGVRTDAVYFVLNHLFVQSLTSIAAFVGSARAIRAFGAASLVPHWHLPFQVFALLFLTDLAQYGLHRAMHEIPWLWRIHAVHHSSEKLDALAGSRVHVVETLITRTSIAVVLSLCGVSRTAILIYGALIALQATFIHADVRVPYRWLERVIVSPRFHHWHHSSDAEAIDTNYAGTFPWIDRLFGTHHLPRDRWPLAYGTVKERVPASVWAQLLFPFLRTPRGTRA